MKELILFCAVAAVFVLCGFILKKMGAFFESDKNAPPKSLKNLSCPLPLSIQKKFPF